MNEQFKKDLDYYIDRYINDFNNEEIIFYTRKNKYHKTTELYNYIFKEYTLKKQINAVLWQVYRENRSCFYSKEECLKYIYKLYNVKAYKDAYDDIQYDAYIRRTLKEIEKSEYII